MAPSTLMDEDRLDGLPTGGVGPIVRRPLQEEVAARLRDLITQGTIAPGTRINEVALCAKLGVSRTPLREAVRMLAGEGLVELVPARGAVVRKVTLKDVTDSLTVLRNLEGLAGELACSEASEEGIARVVTLHEAMMDRYAARDRMAYFKLNQAIHTAIVALSGNATLIWAHEAIQARMKHIRFIGNAGPEKGRRAPRPPAPRPRARADVRGGRPGRLPDLEHRHRQL